MLSDELEALAKRHGALSYRNRADTANPAFGFSVAGLKSLLAEVRKDDTELIRQLVEALEVSSPNTDREYGWKPEDWMKRRTEAIRTARAWLEGKP